MKKRESASEFLARLEQDPSYVAERAKRDQEFQKRDAALAEAEASLVAALRAAGPRVESVWDLVNDHRDQPAVVPILFEHLSRPYPAAVREGIARALAMPSVRPRWEQLVERYREESDSRVRDGLAAAIAAVATDANVGSIIDLVTDQSNGPSRVLLLGALARSKDPSARTALVVAQHDADLEKEARFLLRTSG